MPCDTPLASLRACLRHRTVVQCSGIIQDLQLCLQRQPGGLGSML